MIAADPEGWFVEIKAKAEASAVAVIRRMPCPECFGKGTQLDYASLACAVVAALTETGRLLPERKESAADRGRSNTADVEQRPHGIALKFNHGIELFFSDPNKDRMMIWLTWHDGNGDAFELTEEHRLALWGLFTPSRSST